MKEVEFTTDLHCMPQERARHCLGADSLLSSVLDKLREDYPDQTITPTKCDIVCDEANTTNFGNRWCGARVVRLEVDTSINDQVPEKSEDSAFTADF